MSVSTVRRHLSLGLPERVSSALGSAAIPGPSRTQIVIWLGLVAAVLLVSLSNYQSYQIGTHYDDARYIVLAQSLAFSNQYGMINGPAPIAPGKYPFGYPLLLVPGLRLFPERLDLLKIPSLFAT